MRSHTTRLPKLLAGATLASLLAFAANADDTEIFTVQPQNVAQPNILLIIDTSGSMNLLAESTPLPYDPTQTYSNSGTDCDSSRIYYSTSSTPPTTCRNLSSFPASALKCGAANTQLAYGNGSATGAGFYSDQFIRWRGSGNSRTWQANLSEGGRNTTASDVECRGDAGVHGPDATSAAKWPQAGSANQSNGRWTNSAGQSWWATGSGLSVTLYSPNYIRYLRNGPKQTQTRLDVVRAAAASFLNSLPDLNVGVMRYSTNSSSYSNSDSAAAGGMIMSPVTPLSPKRAQLIADITSSDKYLPHGWTPLSETLFEAYRYFSGGPVEYGKNSMICTRVNSSPGQNGTCAGSTYMRSFPSVAESHDGTNYISPATESCQANYIVYLTDGEATQDSQSNAAIRSLPNFDTLAGVGCSGNGHGDCLGALTEYMFNADLRPNVEGQQNVRTYFIGFGPDFSGDAAAFEKLQNAATRGGGQAYQADDLSSLSAVFNSIITNILQTSTTFTTPTVAVNAFNRTQTLDELFISVFEPASGTHWPGNLKKYRIVDGVILDSRDRNAVDRQTGFFADDARSYWSARTDGPQVRVGGAASLLPSPADRNLYTYIGPNMPGTAVNLSSHPLAASNADLTEEVLNLSGGGDPTVEELIDWARGVDVRDEDGDPNTTVRRALGDPIHSSPAVVIYGGTPENPRTEDAVVFLATNDGYLHAFDAESGEELWAFVPQQFLPHLKELFFDNPVPTKRYALDGELTVLKYDVNGDGIVDASANDRVILYFGSGRGGNRYFALDVTNKNAPKFLWSIGPEQLPGIGQTWSRPVIARVNVAGATQNSQKLVLVLGGGYDPAQDAAFYTTDTIGNRLFIVDALYGTRLWSAGPSGADLNLARMTHSIPSSVTVLDLNGDGFADRMYVGDMAAQLWRFDITNGNDRGSLVTGGVMASLGAKAEESPTEANARRFYSRPDVAAVQRPGLPPILNIAIGSGWRGHPLNSATQDRFYSIRDREPFARRTQAQYDAWNIITESDLYDITEDVRPNIPVESPGWMLLLNNPEWRGEKSLSAANTFDNKIFFTTYTPPTGENRNACVASSTGTNRAYVVDVLTGAPIPRNRDGDGGGGDGDGNGGGNGNDGNELTKDDRFDDLAQGGIAPEVNFLFPEKDTVTCLSGVEVLNVCKNFNSRIKTYWRESNAY